jgi:hypothetical protein
MNLRRLGLLLPAGLALLAGLDAALLLLGLPAPVSTSRLPQVHGMVLVLGFVGTLIALERAVALGRRAGYAAPALLGAAGVALVSPAPLLVGKVALVLGTVGLVAVYVPLWRRQRDDAVVVQALGAVLAVGAALLWLGGVPVPALLPWLAGFVVLTIGAERLELSRVALPRGGDDAFLGWAAGVVLGVTATLLWPAIGYPMLGVALLGLVWWLVGHDVARRTIRAGGLARFMAGCLLAGYAWLAVAALVWLLAGAALEGPRYDTVVHAVFLGFTLSMIMAHAPVILPAVLRRPLPYRPAMIAPAVLLHASLALRVGWGDARQVELAWQVGGVLNILAVLSFLLVAVVSTALGRRPPRPAEEVAA